MGRDGTTDGREGQLVDHECIGVFVCVAETCGWAVLVVGRVSLLRSFRWCALITRQSNGVCIYVAVPRAEI